MSAGGRLCTLQENPHFWVPTIKVRPPDGNLSTKKNLFHQNLLLFSEFHGIVECKVSLVDGI